MNEVHFKNFIVQLLRRGTYKWKPKYVALERTKIKVYPKNKDGTESKKYQVFWECELTGAICSAKEKVVDHINPVVPLDWAENYWDWKVVIENMFCSEDNLQVISKKAHKAKTNIENQIRRDFKKGLVDKESIPELIKTKLEIELKKLKAAKKKAAKGKNESVS